MNKHILSIAVLIFICMVSCRKDEIINVETNDMIEEELFMMNVTGVVEDLTSSPIAGVLVSIGSKSALTDELGVFSISGASGSNLGSYVSVQKEGYFSAGKNIYASSDGKYKINLKMLSRGDGFNFNTVDGITVSVSNEAELSIPADGISLNGNPYTGNAVAYATWLDPTLDQSFETMPGNLNGLDEDANRVSLQTFGMLAVDIFSESGESLNIMDGVKASLKFPIPDELSSQAPEAIDLWHFDEITGNWVEEGQANKSGSHYLAEVGHFSWWNCDIAFETSFLCIQFLDRQGNHLLADNIIIELSSDLFGVATAYINGESSYCGIVPQNEIMTLSIYSLCGELLWSQEVGPYDTEISEETLGLELLDVRLVNVSGLITDCEDMPAGNAYVLVDESLESFPSFTDENGNYELNFYVCETTEPTIEITAVDLDAFKQSNDSFILDDMLDEYVVDIKACDEIEVLEPFFQFTDSVGNEYFGTNCFARVTPVETLIVAESDEFQVILGVKGFSTGDFVGNYIGPNSPTESGFDLTNFNITVFGDVDENVIGTFIHSESGEEGTFIATRIQ